MKEKNWTPAIRLEMLESIEVIFLGLTIHYVYLVII